MNKRKRNVDGVRVCVDCKESKPLTAEHFYRDKNRYLGFMYRCKGCDKKRIDPRTWAERAALHTPEQKLAIIEANKKYRKTPVGRALFILKAYQTFDKKKGMETSLTKEDILKARASICTYCGYPATGFDRVYNNIGHTKENCVPACSDCNCARMDNFTHEEMKELGKAIKQIKDKRA